MICHPSHQKPAGPIVAAKHEHTGKNREKPDEANPKDIISKWRRHLELSGMVGKSDGAGCNEQPTDDQNCRWTFLHPGSAGPIPRGVPAVQNRRNLCLGITTDLKSGLGIMILALASTRFALIGQRKAEYYRAVNPIQVVT